MSTPRYAKSNGQAEASNKTILNNIKNKLDAYKEEWVAELHNIIWAYRTTPRTATGESPYGLCYDTEAILPTEILVGTTKTSMVNSGLNNKALSLEKDLLEGKHNKSYIHMMHYQQML